MKHDLSGNFTLLSHFQYLSGKKNAKKQLEGRDTAIQTSMSSNNCIHHLSKQNKKPTIVSAIVEK